MHTRVCACTHVCVGTCIPPCRSKDLGLRTEFQDSGLSFHHVGEGIELRLSGLAVSTPICWAILPAWIWFKWEMINTMLLPSGRSYSVHSERTVTFGMVCVRFQYLLTELCLFSITTITEQYIIDVCHMSHLEHIEWKSKMQILWLSQNYWDNFCPNIPQWV